MDRNILTLEPEWAQTQVDRVRILLDARVPSYLLNLNSSNPIALMADTFYLYWNANYQNARLMYCRWQPSVAYNCGVLF